MAKKVIELWSGEYIYKGKRKSCRWRITKVKKGKYKTFRMVANITGQKKIDVTRQSIDELKEIYRDWQQVNRPSGGILEQKLTILSEAQIKDAELAVRLLPDGKTLEEAVLLAKPIFSAKIITFSNAYKEYVARKERTDENRDGGWGSAKTKIEFENIMRYPLLHFGQKKVSTIEADEIKPYWERGNQDWAGKNKAPISDQSRRNRYKVYQKFFKWVHEKGYHHKHILSGEDIPAPKVAKSARRAPDVIGNEHVETILMECRNSKKYAGWIPYVGLLFFAGLRAGEIHGGRLDASKKDKCKYRALKWEDFHLEPEFEDPYVQLPYTGKMQSNRIIRLPANLVNLLKLSKAQTHEVFCQKITSQTYKTFRKTVGLSERKANAPRHTAISNFYRFNPFTKKQSKGDALTDQFGNSEETRAEFYINTQGLGVKEARKYWEIASDWESL